MFSLQSKKYFVVCVQQPMFRPISLLSELAGKITYTFITNTVPCDCKFLKICDILKNALLCFLNNNNAVVKPILELNSQLLDCKRVLTNLLIE